MPLRQGISNRETPEEEAQEREEFPPVNPDAPPPQDAAGDVGDHPQGDTSGRHTSHKAGVRSVAQKESTARYPDRSMPPSRKVPGAYGEEPGGPEERDRKGTSKPGRHD